MNALSMTNIIKLAFQQMKDYQDLPEQVQNTHEDIIPSNIQQRVVFRDEGCLPQKKEKLKATWQLLQSFASRHKARIYLAVTLLAILYGFVSNNYFRSSLICTYEKEKDCMADHWPPISDKVATFSLLLITDCFVLIFFLYSFFLKKTYRVLTGLGILQHMLLFYTGEFEMSIHDMTGIIKAGHYASFIISAVIFLIFLSLKTCMKMSAKYSIAGIVVFCLLFYLFFLHNQCQSWKKGINGEIQDKEGSCKLKVPLCIYLKAISLIDLNYFFHNCFLGEQYRKYFDKHFSYDIGNGTIVGFDSFQEATEVETVIPYIADNVFKKAKRYKTIQEAKATKKHDVIFDTVEQRYHIDVVYNHTLAQEKAEIRRKYQASSSPPLAKNVLLIFLDSVSRFQTHLKLPKMVSWFEKQTKYKSYLPVEPIQQQLSQSKSEAYEFYKYHALGYTTAHSIFPMFYGYFLPFLEQLDVKNKENITRFISLHKNYSDTGFINSFSSSTCTTYGADLFDMHLVGMVNPKADHQSFSFNCDPNFYESKYQFGYAKGDSASTDRCLYHKTEAEYAFEYTADFFEKYKNNSKFSQINLIEGHDFIGGSVRYIDSAITSFLEQLEKKGHMKDTLVLALSDHGQHHGNSFQAISSDHYNPFFYLAVPSEMNRNYRKDIRLNQQNLISAFNIYHFLMHVAIGSAYPKKHLGLMADLSFQTSCKKANIVFGSQKCVCQDP